LRLETVLIGSFAALLSVGLVGCSNAGGPASAKAASKKGGGDVPVIVAVAKTKDVPVELDVIGNVEASSTVTIKPQVSGELTKAHFREGDFVNAGDLMFEIDPRTLQAQIRQAEANVARSEAMSRQAQANLARDIANAEYAKSQAGRYTQLAQEGVISKEQDQQFQSQAQAQNEAVSADRAAIESSKADIAANHATLDNLRVQLGFTTIRAPITGRTGTLLVKQGNIVTANTSELVTINQLQPVFVAFAIPESQLKSVSGRFGKEKIEVLAAPQAGGEDPHRGVLTFYENTVDPNTGTIKLRGTFPNEDRKLWPGEFVRVRLRLDVLANAVVVPNQAVQTGQDGQFIYVVKDDKTVESRPVTTSTRTGQELVIASGLKAGETVVTEGQLRLAPGMRVMVRTPGAGGGQRGGGPPKKS